MNAIESLFSRTYAVPGSNPVTLQGSIDAYGSTWSTTFTTCLLAISTGPKYPGACTFDLDLPPSVFLVTPLTGDVLSGDLRSDLKPELGLARTCPAVSEGSAEQSGEPVPDPWACPRCGGKEWRVAGTYIRGGKRRRQRVCTTCQQTITTYELPVPADYEVALLA